MIENVLTSRWANKGSGGQNPESGIGCHGTLLAVLLIIFRYRKYAPSASATATRSPTTTDRTATVSSEWSELFSDGVEAGRMLVVVGRGVTAPRGRIYAG